MEDTRRRTAGRNPDLVPGCNGDAGSAGCKCRLVRKRSRHIFTICFLPGCTAVRGANDQKAPANGFKGIAESYAVIRVPKCKPVEETFRFMIRELQVPGLPSVGGLVDARPFSVAGGEHICRIRINTMHVTEIQIPG